MDNIRGPFVGMREMALFAGAGGGILGGQLLGWHTVCGVELDPYCARVLVQRQNDGLLPPFPVWDNVETFDGRPWRGSVDVVSGGFPCQDISVAGKGAGLKGKRSGLWFEMSRIIREVAPPIVFVENVPALVNRGLSVVLGELAEMGYDAAWGVLGAHHVGAPHKRDRVWILAADPQGGGQPVRGGTQGQGRHPLWGNLQAKGQDLGFPWPTEPDVGRVADELADKLDKLGENK